MEMQSRSMRAIRPGPMIAGGILLLTGTAMFLDSAGFADVHLGRLIGPLVLITLGASLVSCRAGDADGAPRGHRRHGTPLNGIWLIGVGVWMLASQNHFFGMDFHTSWPLLIVLGGIIVVIRGLK